MARANKGGQYAITASAVDLMTALSLTGNKFFAKVTVKNAKDAVNECYLGNSDVTAVPANAHLELDAGDSYTFGGDRNGGYVDLSDIYVVGTVNAANILFIQLEE